jgi:hypothetical protein
MKEPACLFRVVVLKILELGELVVLNSEANTDSGIQIDCPLTVSIDRKRTNQFVVVVVCRMVLHCARTPFFDLEEKIFVRIRCLYQCLWLLKASLCFVEQWIDLWRMSSPLLTALSQPGELKILILNP